MSRVDVLSDCLNQLTMYEKLGKKKVLFNYSNKALMEVLKQLKTLNYIKEYSLTKISKGVIVVVELFSKINTVRSVRPRLNVAKNDFVKFEKRYLPARNFGHLIVSTSKGVMTHESAKKKGVGGILLAYVY